ncbi:bifunctional phosphopantothenoylcysteine decarboxylase/phosphopantothenate--cysteine ligase CoaBC [Lapidilactobacillus luobeiensis]|uniref:bifunctional phosphopantothenoylcysteine decarboxylase/phosphopantothenate--cysteine ligase CoaBC n=1 Tax=Lapidilactobacillus luobeiensis TaxID=2950371 RepID=UPI0021C431C8|nr:bifunctional phosphopantothenoylcysteine decarboxylase/phosphopantothenate--cysteine ligase CoaBC [Lapidilactobacillus luobeiensis]
MYQGKHVLVIVSGGIAAYKIPQFIRDLIKQGAEVQVIMTQAASAFVTAQTLAVVSRHPVYDEHYLHTNTTAISHLDLTIWADLVVVAPATANILAKMAAGIADDLATTALLATNKPIFVFPAMNDQMYAAAATQRNLAQLRADQVTVFEPENGFLAEGYAAKGRMPEPTTMVSLIMNAWQRQQTAAILAGKHVLVTAGGTREAIDPVRYIGNHSSGKMGWALAQAAYWAGATVTVISSVAGPQTFPAETVKVTSTADLQAAVDRLFSKTDLLLMAAAPADFRMSTPAANKIKKQADQAQLQLTLVKNPDILASLKPLRKKQVVVGFAAETQRLLANATTKLQQKQLDLIVANPVGRTDSGFDVDQNQGTLLFADGSQQVLPLMSKIAMAQTIITAITAKKLL